MKNLKLRDPVWMCQQYVTNKLSSYQIAEILEVYPRSVTYWLRKHKIKIRGTYVPNPELTNKAWLKKQVKAKRTVKYIAQSLNVVNSTVRYHLNKFGIEEYSTLPKFDLKEIRRLIAIGTSFRQISFKYGCSQDYFTKYAAAYNIVKPFKGSGKRSKWFKTPLVKPAWLRKMYVTNGLSILKIAKLCNVSYGTVQYFLYKYGIPIRSQGAH